MNTSEVVRPDATQSESHQCTALLERICAAYIRATEQAAKQAKEYCATPWWQNIQRKHLRPVQEALSSRDVSSLREMYENFFYDPCGMGLVRRPPNRGASDTLLHLDDEDNRVIREDALYRIGYWRALTNGRYPISVLQGSNVGNPFGAMIEGISIPAAAEYQHACADRILSLTESNATIVELGGGYGHMAFFLLQATPRITYLDFDIPESLALTAYYLGRSMPDKAMLLYGEADFGPDALRQWDVALMPSWEMTKLPGKSVDLTFSSHVLSDVPAAAREVYLDDVARYTRGLVIDISAERADDHRDTLAEAFDRRFTLVEKRRCYWNKYRAPEAIEWERVYKHRNSSS